ncbi:MAG: NAD+ synthase [Elusimicrobiota bacterium]
MNEKFRLGLAQINTVVGDIEGNTNKVIEYIQKAGELGANIVAFPELTLTGYPPEDLLFRKDFIDTNLSFLKKVIQNTGNIVAVVGFACRENKSLYNSAALIYNRKLLGISEKRFLPNYSVFDEKRYFSMGRKSPVLALGEIKLGVNICEDIWAADGPAINQAQQGAGLIINLSASPYYLEKLKLRENLLKKRAIQGKVFVAYVNLVGGQDELVFDGGSMVFNPKGKLLVEGKQFEEELILLDLDPKELKRKISSKSKSIKLSLPGSWWEKAKAEIALSPKPNLVLEGEVYQALVLGLRDYVRKNGFKKAVIGLSGGIDSSLTAAIAVDALDRENVVGVFMPSQFSSVESGEDANVSAKNLGIEFRVVPILEVFQCYLKVLSREFIAAQPNIAEENLQARIRGNILMAFSNKFGWLVLTTGNKSETSVGYTTLYGDTAGGFAVIKDVPKTFVYRLARYRNSYGPIEVIPQRVLTKAPTAELRPNQKDEDTLPPYSKLDPIIKAYVEDDLDLKEISALGYPKKLVKEIVNLIDHVEYKRRQSPPGIKITPRAFGRDRRMPITNRFRVGE